MESDKSKQDLFDFMMQQMGGEDRVRATFLEEKIAGLSHSDMTIGQLVQMAQDEGWIDWLRSLRFAQFSQLVAGQSSSAVQGGQAGGFKSGKRMRGKEKEALHEAILEYLESHPWSYGAQVAQHVGLPSRQVGLQLRALREAGKVQTQGEKAKMRYAVKGPEAGV